MSLLAKSMEDAPSFDEEITLYNDALSQQQQLLAQQVAEETAAMGELTQLLQA